MAGVGDRSLDVFAVVNAHPAGVGPAEVADALGIPANRARAHPLGSGRFRAL